MWCLLQLLLYVLALALVFLVAVMILKRDKSVPPGPYFFGSDMSQRVTWTEKEFQDYIKRAGKAQAQVDAAVKAQVKSRKIKTQAEAEYELILKAEYHDAQILFQAYTLKLAPDTRYTPDFAVVFENGRVDFHEVKGAFVFAKALNKPKVAAAMFPQHKFFLAQKSQAGWKIKFLPSC